MPFFRENKAEQIRNQVSSFNDELKQTVVQVNHFHQERDKLLSEIELLNSSIKQARQEDLKARNNSVQLLEQLKIESQNADRIFQDNKMAMETQLNSLKDAIKLNEAELTKINNRFISAISNRDEAIEQEIDSINKTKETKKILETERNKLEILRNSVNIFQDKLNVIDKEYERVSLTQSALLEQIKYQESLLRKLLTDTDDKRKVLSKIEEKLYMSDKTFQAREQELKQINQNYQQIIKDGDLIKLNIKKELENLQQEKSVFNNYKIKESEIIKQGLITITGNLKDYQKKERDLNIVTARLKKKWKEINKDLPFPKI